METITKEDELIKISNQPYPWLMICDGANDERHMFYSITEKRYHPRLIRELQNKCITCCYDEWSVVDDFYGDDCFLLNILTMEKRKLPPLYIPNRYSFNCVLSTAPTSGYCRVLFISGPCHTLWSCNVGDNEFIEHDLDLEGTIIMAAVHFKGKLHALTIPGYDLYTANFSDPNLRFSSVITGEVLDKIIPIHNEAKFYLVESCGELFFVHRTSAGREVLFFTFFKADITNKEWLKVDNLGDRAFFLDGFKGFSISQASMFGLRENTVYYVHDFERNLYAYDVKDRRITMSLPCPTVALKSSLFWVSVIRAD